MDNPFFDAPILNSPYAYPSRHWEPDHCYREKLAAAADDDRKGDQRKEAEKNKEAARPWISGLAAVHRTLGLAPVVDISATPFFLNGSGHAEGTLFPWPS